jgi:hypothetical protein
MAFRLGAQTGGSNMFIYKALSAVAAAAFGAAVVLALPGFSPEVEARTPAPVATAPIEIEPAATGPDCSAGWPYYDPSCLQRQHGPNRSVRVIPTDRVVR